MKNEKGLGWRQKHMLKYARKYTELHNSTTVFSIHKDEKKIALSLEKRGLIRIVNKNWERWQIVLA